MSNENTSDSYSEDKLDLSFFNTKHYMGFKYNKSKNSDISGDHNVVGATDHYSFAINCDGVSTTSSPSKSSRGLTEALETYFKSTKSKKPRIGKITEILTKKNKEYLKKDLASTIDLFVFSKKFNYYVGLGDSSFYIFNENKEVIFQNWIHNQSKIIEDHFSSKVGEDHVLVNCIGIQRPRFEMSENIKLSKGFKLLFHSDGIEQFFDSSAKVESFCHKVLEHKSLDETFFSDNDDDLSLIYIIMK